MPYLSAIHCVLLSHSQIRVPPQSASLSHTRTKQTSHMLVRWNSILPRTRHMTYTLRYLVGCILMYVLNVKTRVWYQKVGTYPTEHTAGNIDINWSTVCVRTKDERVLARTARARVAGGLGRYDAGSMCTVELEHAHRFPSLIYHVCVFFFL